MRKITFFASLLFLLIGLNSCSSDDDSGDGSGGNNPIVGEWTLESSIDNDEVFEPSPCEAQSSLEFHSDGTFIYTTFWEEGETENCVSETSTEEWEYLGDNVYEFTDEEDDSYTANITLSNSNNTFTVTEEDEDGLYIATYTRI